METAVVLGIIVVLLAVSVPVLARQNQVQKLEAAARQLACDLREVQQLARTRRVTCQVVFDSPAGTYTVFAGGTRVRGPVEVPVAMQPAFAGTDPAVVTFDSMGRANEGVVTLSSPGGTRQVHVGRAATVYITR